MKILIIASGIPSKQFPGDGVFEYDQAKALLNLGHTVIFAAINFRSLRRHVKPGFIYNEDDGLKQYILNIPLGNIPSWILRKSGIYFLKILYKSIQKKEGNPDIIHAHFGLLGGYYCEKLCKRIKLPFIITEHDSSILEDNISKMDINRLTQTYKSSEKVIAVGGSLSKKIKYYTGIEALIISNIVDTTSFTFKQKKIHKDFTFVSVGNLVKGKGMDFLINSFQKAFLGNSSPKLYIFGGGIEKNILSKKIANYGMKSQIVLMDYQKRQVISEKFAESDCFVLASESETFGVAYIEALASGLPVIATKCHGPEDFINEGNGLLVNVNNEEELIDSLKYMYKNIGIYNPLKISENAIIQFSPEKIALQLTKIYESVLNKPVIHIN